MNDELQPLLDAFVKADNLAQKGDKQAAEDAAVFAAEIRAYQPQSQSQQQQSNIVDGIDQDAPLSFITNLLRGSDDAIIEGVNNAGEAIVGGLETTANTVSKAVAQPVALGAGYLNKYVTGDGSDEQALASQRYANEALTYQPRTDRGQAGADYAAGLIEQFNQGATRNFSDELQGIIGIGDYREIQSAVDERQQQFSEENPVASTVAEVGGSLLTPVLGRGGTTAGSRALNASKEAALDAFVSSLGRAEGGTLSDARTFQNAAIDAGIASVTAPVISGAINKFAQSLPSKRLDDIMKTSERLAQERLSKQLADNGVDVTQLQSRLQNMVDTGVIDPRLADIPELAPVVRLANQKSQLSQSVRDDLQQRTAAQGQRLADAVSPPVQYGDELFQSRATGQPYTVNNRTLQSNFQGQGDDFIQTRVDDLSSDGQVNYSNVQENLKAQVKELTEPLYSQAAKTNFNPSAIPKAIRNNPTVVAARKVGIRQVQDLKDANRLQTTGSTTFSVWHQTQQELSRLYKTSRNSNDRANINEFRTAITNALEDASPEYARAQGIYNRAMQDRDAIGLGSGLNKLTSNNDTDAFIKTILDGGNVEVASKTYRNELAAKITKGIRDSKTGDLLKANDISKLQKLLRNENESKAIANLTKARTTAQQAERLANVNKSVKDRSVWNKLGSAIGGDANLIGTAINFMVSPTLAAIHVAIRAYGESSLARKTEQQLFKAMQNKLYKNGVTPDELEAYFNGNVQNLPIDKLRDIVDGLGISTAAAVTDFRQEQR